MKLEWDADVNGINENILIENDNLMSSNFLNLNDSNINKNQTIGSTPSSPNDLSPSSLSISSNNSDGSLNMLRVYIGNSTSVVRLHNLDLLFIFKNKKKIYVDIQKEYFTQRGTSK